jgi:hypothetical protein
MAVQDFRALYPAGNFDATVYPDPTEYVYLDSIELKLGLTWYEKKLLSNHGFVVTSRLAESTMGEAFVRVYNNDLPVYVSTDAILQAVHASYDRILMDCERSVLGPTLVDLLSSLHGSLEILETRYAQDPCMLPMLRDVDVYLTVPRMLLGSTTGPRYTENTQIVQQILNGIDAARPAGIKLFADTERTVDFSQFTVRGHYTRDSVLADYFRAMMWLGRTELYLIAPEGTLTAWPDQDIRRQIIDALLLMEAIESSGSGELLGRMETIIATLVGEQDNVTPAMLDGLRHDAGIQQPAELFDGGTLRSFQDTLRSRGFAYQRINSQILMTDPLNPEQLTPASAFFLLGQRFIIDSYITGNVVYDRIIADGIKVTRMLPSTLDVLFALGNDAAGRLLEPELQRYKYGSNLAALRYLVDSYEPDFWSSSVFNGWLGMLRTLNPPADRTGLPAFMRTGAWWQHKMTTQLASWSQLRHDNLLYAKQSYTGGIICSFPESYVEPVPEFFAAWKAFSEEAARRLPDAGIGWVRTFFERMAGVADTLGTVAGKELDGTPLTQAERQFLQRMLVVTGVCGMEYSGWYPGLHYDTDLFYGRAAREAGLVVADIHTAPTDGSGAPVGWVVHAGTGPADMAVILARTANGRACAFLGPVFSYMEHVTTNFRRLTDEEWMTLYPLAPSFRPDFVNLYLANDQGLSRGAGAHLLTSVETSPDPLMPAVAVLAQNYPNPFNSTTVIPFFIPAAFSGKRVRLEVYDLAGRRLAVLLDGSLPGGAYTSRWSGRTDAGVTVATGVYFSRLTVEGNVQTKRMVLVR